MLTIRKFRLLGLRAVMALSINGIVSLPLEAAEQEKSNKTITITQQTSQTGSRLDKIIVGIAIGVGIAVTEKAIITTLSVTKQCIDNYTTPHIIKHLRDAQRRADEYADSDSQDEAINLEKPFCDVFYKINNNDIKPERGDIKQLQTIKQTIASCPHKNDNFFRAVNSRYLELINPHRKNETLYGIQKEQVKHSTLEAQTQPLKLSPVKA